MCPIPGSHIPLPTQATPKILVLVLPALELSSEVNLACLASLELEKRPTPQPDGGTGHGKIRYMGVHISLPSVVYTVRSIWSGTLLVGGWVRYTRMVMITESLEGANGERSTHRVISSPPFDQADSELVGRHGMVWYGIERVGMKD